LKTINVPQFSLVIKKINYNLEKVLIGGNVIYENQHVSKVLHSTTTILLWQIFTILQIFFSKKRFVSFQQQIAKKIKKSTMFLHIIQLSNQYIRIIYTFIASLWPNMAKFPMDDHKHHQIGGKHTHTHTQVLMHFFMIIYIYTHMEELFSHL